MVKLKKLLALGLAAAMTLSLAACGSSQSSSESGAAASSDSSSSSSDSASSGSDEYVLYNEGEPRTIRIGTWYSHYYDSTHTDIHDDPSVSDEERAQMHFDIVKEVEEKYNVKLEFVNLTWDGIQESINTSILAGKPDCDIYEVDLSFGVPAVYAGYVQNLDEVLPSDADVLNDGEILTKVDAGKDGTYMFMQNSAEVGLYNTYMLAFNKQMLDDAGLEDPNALYERGEWTWDKWREYMMALTQDTNGDGVIDVYGYGSRFDFLVYLMLMSNGTTIASSPTENISSPEVAECLDFIYNMYNVDHVAKPWDADDFNANMNNYMDGAVASWIDAAWISSQNSDATLGFDIIWTPFPIGPSGNADTNARKNSSSGNAYMIPTGVDNPALVYMAFQDWANWYHGDTDYRDEDLTWWEDCAITEENYKVMEYVGQAGGFDLWNSLGVDYQWVSLLDGTMTAAQFQETNKQLVQSALDQMMK